MEQYTIQEGMAMVYKKALSDIKIMPEVPSYFRGFFKDVTTAAKGFSYNIFRNDRITFHDQGQYSEPLLLRINKSSNKLFVPGFWEIGIVVEAYESWDRILSGKAEFLTDGDLEVLSSDLMQAMRVALDGMDTTEEVMCASALINGVVPLVHGDSINYHRKVESIRPYAVGTDFSDNAIDPRKVLVAMAEQAVTVGMASTSDIFRITAGTLANEAFWNNTFIKEAADVRRYETITHAPTLKLNGVTTQGVVKCGDYHFEFVTYGGRYKSPEGVDMKLMPDKKILMMPIGAEVENIMGYAGTKAMSGSQFDPNSMPIIKQGKRNFDTHTDHKACTITKVFRSRPLAIVREIDKPQTLDAIA